MLPWTAVISGDLCTLVWAFGALGKIIPIPSAVTRQLTSVAVIPFQSKGFPLLHFNASMTMTTLRVHHVIGISEALAVAP